MEVQAAVLKPCPFCGGEAYARYSTSKREVFGYAAVECRKCGAAPYIHQMYAGPGKEEAIKGVVEAWNRRTYEQQGIRDGV